MAEQWIGPKTFADRVVNPCGCQLTVPPSEASFTYCPMHKAAPALLDALIANLDALDTMAKDSFAWQRSDGHAVMRQVFGLEVAKGQEAGA